MKKAILLLCTCAFLITGCNTDKATGGTEVTKEVETTMEETEAAAENQTIYWINGTSAILTKTNRLDLKYFGGAEDPQIYEQTMQKTLDEYWGITNKEELLDVVENLRTNQMHNQSFLEELAKLGCDTSMTIEDFEQFMNNAGHDRNETNYMSAGYQAYIKYGDNAIFAWDLSRATQLLGSGYLAGFINYEEALDLALEISKEIQTTFDSWDSFWDSYLMGYVYWSEDSMINQTSTYAKRVKLLEELQSSEDSPLQLDWNMELSKDW